MLHLLLSIVWCLIAFVKHLKHTQYREIVCFVFRYKCIYLKKNLFFSVCYHFTSGSRSLLSLCVNRYVVVIVHVICDSGW